MEEEKAMDFRNKDRRCCSGQLAFASYIIVVVVIVSKGAVSIHELCSTSVL